MCVCVPEFDDPKKNKNRLKINRPISYVCVCVCVCVCIWFSFEKPIMEGLPKKKKDHRNLRDRQGSKVV